MVTSLNMGTSKYDNFSYTGHRTGIAKFGNLPIGNKTVEQVRPAAMAARTIFLPGSGWLSVVGLGLGFNLNLRTEILLLNVNP